jgi:hypothetical protein
MPFSSRYGFEDFVEATHSAASRERLYELLLLAVGSYGFDCKIASKSHHTSRRNFIWPIHKCQIDQSVGFAMKVPKTY